MGLLRVCREVYNEALTVFYGGNKFRVRHPRTALSWLRSIGHASLAELRHVRLDIHMDRCYVRDGDYCCFEGDGLDDDFMHEYRYTDLDYLRYTQKFFTDLWVSTLSTLTLYAKSLRTIELSLRDPKTKKSGDWVYYKDRPMHAFSWTLQIRVIKAITRLKGVTRVLFHRSFAQPVKEYIIARLGAEVSPGPYEPARRISPWHLEILVKRVKKEKMILSMPKEKMIAALSNGDGSAERPGFIRSGKNHNMELDEGCRFYYWCYDDVKEAVEFQEELDQLGIRDGILA